MTIYINVDTSPNPDCIDGDYVIYTLYPPSDEPWSLTWKDEDDDETEELLCNIFNGEREMEGCIVVHGTLDLHIESICQTYGIIINKIGERLEEC